MTPLLSTHGLTSFYGDFQALYGLDLTFDEGDTIAIIGANGAGKSTLLRTLTGLLKAAPDAVRFAGEAIGGLAAPDIMARGIAMVPEGRKLFPSLSVEENLLIGADRRKGDGRWNLETLYQLFPILKERRHNPGTALSGGQQQMVAISRALMSNPRLLLCDEISLGLAPVVIKDIYAALPKIKEAGTTIVIVEQDIVQALAVANKVYCLQEGRMTLSGTPAELTREAIQEAYFGH
jgi:branched-chain amino acid transport system ATP-binding protein